MTNWTKINSGEMFWLRETAVYKIVNEHIREILNKEAATQKVSETASRTIPGYIVSAKSEICPTKNPWPAATINHSFGAR